jgi:uncharacterized protein (TIGR02145 family)
VDSLNVVASSERKINLDKSNKISELTNTITRLEGSISSLNADVSKLNSELQQSKTESATKAQEISNLQTQLKTKTDSLTLVINELEKLNLALKLAVSNNTTSKVTKTGSFKSVKIGNQIWMAENLNVSTFSNGDPIPEAKTNQEWKKAGDDGKPAWCYYDNDTSNGRIYGKLYNWYAVNDPRGLAPLGWHIPTEKEWIIIQNYLGIDAGKKMKSTSGWNKWEESIICSICKGKGKINYDHCKVCKGTGRNVKKIHTSNGTNSSGFTGLPGGDRNSAGSFMEIGAGGGWWSSSEYGPNYAWWWGELSTDFIDNLNGATSDKSAGSSVRCVKD